MTQKPQILKEIDPGFSISKPDKKTVLICTNGFQNSDVHDATFLIQYFKENFASDYQECEIAPVQLFHPGDPKTHRARKYEQILDEAIRKYDSEGYDIILMGYSFSASLACKMQHRYPSCVKKLILLAPIYDTLLNGMIHGYLRYLFKFYRLSKKYGAKVAKAMGRNTTKGMFGLLLSILRSILRCRGYYKKVSCDTLILRGDKDDLCNDHSINKIRKHMNVKNALYIYSGMDHGIMKTIRDNAPVFEDILHFSFDTPFLLETESLALSKKVKTQPVKIKYDEDGEPIPTFAEIFTELDPDAETSRIEDQEAL